VAHIKYSVTLHWHVHAMLLLLVLSLLLLLTVTLKGGATLGWDGALTSRVEGCSCWETPAREAPRERAPEEPQPLPQDRGQPADAGSRATPGEGAPGLEPGYDRDEAGEGRGQGTQEAGAGRGTSASAARASAWAQGVHRQGLLSCATSVTPYCSASRGEARRCPKVQGCQPSLLAFPAREGEEGERVRG